MSALRILVPVKRVIDYAVKPRISPTRKAVVTENVKHSLNPFDEIAIEEAVRLRERRTKTHSGKNPKVEEIIAFTIGSAKSIEVLKTAMAMGADRSIFVEIKEGEEPKSLGVAKVLASVVKKEGVNLVLAGKQSIDSDAGCVGGMLGGLLGWTYASQACKVAFENASTCVVEKEVDGGTETIKGHLPMVITTDLRLNEPRYASLPNIMKAKKKKVDRLTPELVIDMEKRLLRDEFKEPPKRKGGGKVLNVDDMIKRLKEMEAL